MHRRMKGEASEVGSALLGAPSIWRCSAQGVQCLRLCGAERIPRPRIAVCYRKPRPQQKLETRNDAAEHGHYVVVTAALARRSAPDHPPARTRRRGWCSESGRWDWARRRRGQL